MLDFSSTSCPPPKLSLIGSFAPPSARDRAQHAGAKGILITPSASKAIMPAIAEARAAGLRSIAHDTLLDPADATFVTDHFKAGVLIGAGALGSPAG